MGAAGAAQQPRRAPATRRSPTARRSRGYGIGYGLRATPAGVYVIKNGEVEWKPAVDVNRDALQRTGTIIVGLFVLRSIIRTLVRR